MSDDPIIEVRPRCTRFQLTIERRPTKHTIYKEAFERGPLDFKFDQFDFVSTTTLEIDRETYDRLIGDGPTCTLEVFHDYNPWHRSVTGWARARKLRDGAWWTFRKRILRHKPIENVKMTVPDCKLEPLP